MGGYRQFDIRRVEHLDARVGVCMTERELSELRSFADVNGCTLSAAARWLIVRGLAMASAAEGGELR